MDYIYERYSKIFKNGIWNIYNYNIRKEEFIVFAKTLETDKTIYKLNLSYNNIDDDCIIALAKALKSNQTLHTLNLDNNKISDIGLSVLIPVLLINKTLHTLTISYNNITKIKPMTILLIRILEKKTIHTLGIYGYNIDNRVKNEINVLLNRNYNLYILNEVRFGKRAQTNIIDLNNNHNIFVTIMYIMRIEKNNGYYLPKELINYLCTSIIIEYL